MSALPKIVEFRGEGVCALLTGKIAVRGTARPGSMVLARALDVSPVEIATGSPNWLHYRFDPGFIREMLVYTNRPWRWRRKRA